MDNDYIANLTERLIDAEKRATAAETKLQAVIDIVNKNSFYTTGEQVNALFSIKRVVVGANK